MDIFCLPPSIFAVVCFVLIFDFCCWNFVVVVVVVVLLFFERGTEQISYSEWIFPKYERNATAGLLRNM